ncbi:MAG: TerB family tellurite resistance protein [Candidatus Thiodiazotropha sp.]
MNPENATLSIALFAAFADGHHDDREREHLREITRTLGIDSPELSRHYQDILLRQITLENACNALGDSAHRQLAYEMAVGVCHADDRLCDAEQRFLVDLRQRLSLADDPSIREMEQQAQRLTDWTFTHETSHPGPSHTGFLAQEEAELNRAILNYAILNGALEILPQSWSSMAIIPLQLKMVYEVGLSFGHELDRGHIKEFLATLGIGLTSQYVEQIGRKLLGGLLGKLAGKGVGGVGSLATGVTLSFATTYALGHIAKDYYAAGRQMSSDELRQSFQNMLEPAKALQSRYLGKIQQRSETLDMSQILSMVRN